MPKPHVTVNAEMEPKGAVGVKDMLFNDVRRLTVNGSGGPVKDCENAFVASLYLMRDEAVTVANALLPESMTAVDRADLHAAAALVRDYAGSDSRTQELVERLFAAAKATR